MVSGLVPIQVDYFLTIAADIFCHFAAQLFSLGFAFYSLFCPFIWLSFGNYFVAIFTLRYGRHVSHVPRTSSSLLSVYVCCPSKLNGNVSRGPGAGLKKRDQGSGTH